jgi:hypothetical protein
MARRYDGPAGVIAAFAWHLHPTFLRALGMKNKIRLGAGFTPVFKLLRWAKWLRGTPFDLLGRRHLRLDQARRTAPASSSSNDASVPAMALAATVAGLASHTCPGPERPGKLRLIALTVT